MRILLVVQNYPPERGPVRYTYNVATLMARLGHDVTVITGIPHYPTGKPYHGFSAFKPTTRFECGVKVIRMPLIMASNRQILRRILGFLSFMIISFFILLIKRCDVIVASVPPATVPVAAWLASVMKKKPFAVILRDIEPLDSLRLRGMDKWLPGRALIALGMSIYRRAHHLVVIHSGQADTLQAYRISATKLTTIPHCIDAGPCLQPAATSTTQHLPKREGRATLLYLGTIGVSHDIQTLIDAMSDRRIQNLLIDLIIIGDGECVEICRGRIAQHQLTNVRMLPTVPLEEVPAILRQADLLVSSFREGQDSAMSSKIYEYCASGLPIAVFGKSGAAQLVREVGNGWVCNERNADALHAVLLAFLVDRKAAAARGLLGHQYVISQRNTERFSEQWSTVLQRLLP